MFTLNAAWRKPVEVQAIRTVSKPPRTQRRWNRLLGRLALLAVLAAATRGTMPEQAEAGDIDWSNSGSANWSTASNWSTGAVPGSSATVYIESGGTCNLTTSGTCSFLIIGGNNGSDGGAGTLVINSTGALTVNGPSGLRLGPTTTPDVSGTLTLSAGSLIIEGNGNLTVGGDATTTTVNLLGGTLDLTGGSIASGIGSFNFSGGVLQDVSQEDCNINFTGGTVLTTTANTVFNATFSNTGTLTKTGTGTMTLVGTAANSGLTLNLGASAGTVILSQRNGYAAAAIANIGGGSTVQLQGANQILTTGIIALGGGTFDLYGNSLQIDHLSGVGTVTTSLLGAVTLTIGSSNNGSSTFGGVIQNGAGGLALTKVGTGILTLAGANTYSGTTTINAGVLNAGIGETPGVSGPFGAQAATAAGTILFGGGTLQYSAANHNDYSGRFSTGGSQPISIDTNGQTVTFSTAITGLNTSLTLNDSTGAGTLILAAANSYTGPTTVNAGTLGLPGSLAGSNVTLNGASAAFNEASTGVIGGATTFTLSNGSATLGGTNSYAGPTTVNGANAVFNETPSGALGGATSLTVASGSATLGGNNTYTGPTTVNGGTLGLTGSLAGSTVTVNGAIALFNETSTGVIGGATTFTVASGSATLGGSNTYTGPTTVNGGTLSITGALSSSSQLAVGGGLFSFSGAGNQAVNGLAVNTGASSVNNTGSGGTLVLGAITRNIGGTVDFPTAAGTTNEITTTSINNTSGTNGILGGWATSGGTTWAVGSSSGSPAAITGFAGYYTTTTGGATASKYNASTYNVDVTSSPTLSGAITVNSLRFNTGAADTLTLTGTNSIASGGVLVTAAVGNYLSKITGGTLEGASGQDLVVIQNNTSNSLTIASVIADNGTPTGLTKSGAGLLLASGANTYTGPTTVNGGTLQAGSTTAFGAAGAASLAVAAGVVDLNGKNVTIGSLLSGSSGTITDSSTSTASTLTVNQTLPETFSGAINSGTKSLALVIEGGSSLTLSNSTSTFSGGLTVDDGTLAIPTINNKSTASTLGDNSSATLGSSGYTGMLDYSGATAGSNLPFSLASSGTGAFQVDGANTVLTLSGVVSGGGSLTKSGPGTLLLSGTNTYSGGTTVVGGMLQISSTAQLGPTPSSPAINITLNGGELYSTSSLSLSGSRSVYLGSNGGYVWSGNGATFTVSGQISGPGGLGVAWDGGVVILTGSNTYQGSTTIGTTANGYNNSLTANPTLQLGSSNALPGSNLIFGNSVNNNTATLDMHGFSATVGGLSGGGNALVDIVSGSGASTLTVGNNNTTSTFGGTIRNTTGSLTLAKTGAGTLTLSGSNAYSGGTTIGGGTLSLANSAALPGNITFGGGTLQFTAGNTQDYSGNIVNSAAPIAIDTNSQSVTFAGVLNSSNSGGLTKIGAGTLTLSGSNAYSGGTTINAGTLNINADAALGAGGVTFAGNGTLQAGSNGITLGAARGLTINAGATATIDTQANALTIAGAIGGNGSLTKIGAGILDLSGGNIYSGATNVNAGALVLDQGGSNSGALGGTAVNVAGGATLIVKGNASIAAGGSLTVAGGASPGCIDLRDGTINTFTVNGNLNLGNAGGAQGSVLDFDFGSGSADLIASTGALSVSGSNVINLNLLGSIVGGTYPLISATNGGLLASQFQIGAQPLGGFSSFSLASSAGNTELVLIVTANPTPGAAYWTGAASLSLGDTANSWGAAATSGGSSASNWSTTSNGTNDPQQIPGSITNVVLSAGNATGGSAAAVTTTLDKSYSINSLTFAVSTGTLASVTVNTDGNLLTIGSGGLTLAAASNASGTISGTNSLAVNGSQSWANNSNSQNLTVSTGIAASSGATTLTLNGTGSGGVTFSGAITNGSGTLAVNSSQAGVTLFAGANTYSGGTTISAGTLQLGSSASLPAGKPVTVNGTLDLNTYNAGASGLSGTGTIDTVAGGSPTLTLGIGNATSTFGGTIQNSSGALALQKVGAGVLCLTGTNTYSGGTTISAGTLQVLGSAALSPNSGLAVNAGVLDLGATTQTAGTVGINGGTVQNGALNGTALSIGSGVVQNASLNGNAVTVSGGTVQNSTLSGTALNINNGLVQNASLNGNAINISGGLISGGTATGTSFNISGGTIGATLAGVGATLTQSGGLAILSASNTYSGGTTISGGTLQVGNGGSGASIAGTSGLLDNGTLVFNHGDTETFSPVISGSGSLAKLGSGILSLLGANTYSGATVLTSGAINIGQTSGSLPNSFSNVLFNGTSGATAGVLQGNGTLNLSTGSLGGEVQWKSSGGGFAAQGGKLTVTLDGGATETWGSGFFDITENLVFGSAAADSPVVFTNNIQFGNSTRTIYVTQGVGGDYAVLAGNLLSTGSGGGPVLANELLELTGSNSYSGPTEINGGTLQVQGNNALPAASPVTIGGATLQVRNNGAGNGGVINLGNSITVSSGATTDDIDVGAIASTNSGNTVSGNTVALGVLSNGTTANAYRSTIGFTAVNGYLQSYAGLNLPGSTGNTTTLDPTTTSVIIAGNVANQETNTTSGHFDTLDLDGTSTNNLITGVISDAPGCTGVGYADTRITKSNTSAWILAGSNTYSGPTTISGGTLQIGNGGNSGTLGYTSGVTDNAALVFDRSDNGLIVTVAISGSGSLSQIGAGQLTLAGSNKYSGPTTVSAGVLVAGAASAFSASSAFTVNGGTLDATAFAQTVKSLTVGPLGALNLAIGKVLTSSGTASLNGTLNLFGSTGGSEELIGYPSYSGSFASVSGVPAGYALQYTPSQLDLVLARNNSVLGASAFSINLGRMLAGYPASQTVNITLAGGNNATGFTVAGAGGATPLAYASGNGAVGPSSTGSFTASIDADVLGNTSGTLTVQNIGNDGAGTTGSAGAGEGSAQSPISIGVTGTVVANRAVTATSVNFGVVHLGDSLSQGFTLSTTGDDSQYTRVTVPDSGIDSNSFLAVSGGVNPTFNGPSVTDYRTLSGTPGTAGAFNGAITLATSGEGLAGESPIPVTVNYSVQVFSGSGRWTDAVGSTSWSNSSNWTDASGSGVQAAPGAWGYNDTAVLDDRGGTKTITLDGASPTLAALTIGTTGGGYTLAQGSGGTLNLSNGTNSAAVVVSSGTQSISAPITLGSNGAFAPAAGTQLFVSGAIGGTGALSLTAAGDLILSGSNSYAGGTDVDTGTLYVTNASALTEGTSLTIGAGGTFVFDPSVSPIPGETANNQVRANTVAAVPEPGTLALLSAAGIVAAAAAWRRRKKVRVSQLY